MFKVDTAIDATGYRKPAIIINVEGDEWEASIDRSNKLELIADHPELTPEIIVERIKKDVNWLLQAGYLQNAVADEEKVILLRENEFINLTCPTCGASNEIRIGSSNKCKHCGSYLRRV